MKWEQFKVTGKVQNGSSGDWSVDTIECSERDAAIASIQEALSGSGRGVTPGTYTRLMRGKTVVMSDTKDEIEDVMPFLEEATGSVLIAGLGLGIVPRALLKIGKVRKIFIVEKSRDVAELTGDGIMTNPKVTVFFGDIFEEHKSPLIQAIKPFDFGWFDIWDDLSPDNLPEMKDLAKKYARICKKSRFWGKEFILGQIRIELFRRTGNYKLMDTPEEILLDAVIKTQKGGNKGATR